jgi:hypothetical protein
VDFLDEWRLNYMRETMDEVMERPTCRSYQFVSDRTLPVVCALPPGHGGPHRFTEYVWD